MKWGIIGTGRIATTFARAIQRVPGAEVVAVASHHADRADAFAQRFGIRRCYTNARQLAADRDVQIVYVATTHDCHESDSLAAIAERKPVLCEKPIAPDYAAACRIAAAAGATRTFCMEGLWSLCLPVYREGFDRIRRGEIGEVRDIAGTFAVRVPYDEADRIWDRRRHGGALLDRGVYLVALALALLDDADAVYATTARADNGVDASTWFVLEGTHGARCRFAASLEFCGTNEFSAQGTAGTCTFFAPSPCPPGYLLRHENLPLRNPHSPEGLVHHLKHWLKSRRLLRRVQHGLLRGSCWHPGGLEFEIMEVERCVLAGLAESPCVPLDRSLRALAILDRVAALGRAHPPGVIAGAAEVGTAGG